VPKFASNSRTNGTADGPEDRQHNPVDQGIEASLCSLIVRRRPSVLQGIVKKTSKVRHAAAPPSSDMNWFAVLASVKVGYRN
jgi:hypothetical protein